MYHIVVLLIVAFIAAPPVFSGETLAPYAEWKRNGDGERLLTAAREWVHHWLVSSDDPPELDAPEWRGAPTGVFVTLMRGPSVRACVGEIHSSGESLAAVLAEQCRRLTRDDLRHQPISLHELPRLRLVVTLTGAPEPLEHLDAVDVWNQGLLAEHQERAAALLPGEAKTLAWGVRFLLRQMGALPSDPVRYSRFPVIVFSELEDAKSPRAALIIERFPVE